jgi:putative peptidoglycan binding protein
MRILLVLVCSLALVSMVYGAQKEEKKSKPKKQAQTAQGATQRTNAAGGGASGKKASTATRQVQNSRNAHTATAANDRQKGKKNETLATANQGQKRKSAQTSNAAYQSQKGKKNQTKVARQTANAGQVKGAGKPNQAKTATGQNAAKGKFAQGKPLKPQHFNLAKQPNTAKAPPVKFQQGRRIQGSQNWQGQQYTVFRDYKSEWHDQNWWRGRYGNNITFVFGAPYYWRAGYWFPAWGYYPNAYYAWDGPIYAYNRLPPDQVIANVQAALQQQGYYRGEVDGLIGPLTRGAIADYQRDHGLYMTSTIDQPTLRSLGIS